MQNLSAKPPRRSYGISSSSWLHTVRNTDNDRAGPKSKLDSQPLACLHQGKAHPCGTQPPAVCISPASFAQKTKGVGLERKLHQSSLDS